MVVGEECGLPVSFAPPAGPFHDLSALVRHGGEFAVIMRAPKSREKVSSPSAVTRTSRLCSMTQTRAPARLPDVLCVRRQSSRYRHGEVAEAAPQIVDCAGGPVLAVRKWGVAARPQRPRWRHSYLHGSQCRWADANHDVKSLAAAPRPIMREYLILESDHWANANAEPCSRTRSHRPRGQVARRRLPGSRSGPTSQDPS